MKTFTGKQIKQACAAMAKTGYDVVVRFNGTHQTLEIGKDNQSLVITIDAEVNFCNLGNYAFVDMYASQYNTDWTFFLSAIKPNDEIVFTSINNGPLGMSDQLRVTELRANVTRRKPDGTLKQVIECHICNEYKIL